MHLGLDIDDTITAAPQFFARLSRLWRADGREVYIISTRTDSLAARSETVRELHSYGVEFDGLYLLPSAEQAKAACPHPTLDWYQRYLWQKVALAQQLGVTVFFDDDEKVIMLFRQFAPEIAVFRGAR